MQGVGPGQGLRPVRQGRRRLWQDRGARAPTAAAGLKALDQDKAVKAELAARKAFAKVNAALSQGDAAAEGRGREVLPRHREEAPGHADGGKGQVPCRGAGPAGAAVVAWRPRRTQDGSFLACVERSRSAADPSRALCGFATGARILFIQFSEMAARRSRNRVATAAVHGGGAVNARRGGLPTGLSVPCFSRY